MSRIGRRGRWAISFADLCLLLLGFFVLLQAHEAQRRDQALAALKAYFSAGKADRDVRADLAARQLFVPQEAVMTDAGRARIAGVAARLRAAGGTVRLSSRGMDPGTVRFDGWDLASARVGALARALVAAGVAPRAIRITGPDSRDGDHASGQYLMIRTEPAAP